MIRKIAVTGPESCGKTSLARALAAHFKTLWVPEFARFYLPYLPTPYTEADVLTMARGQMALEDAIANEAIWPVFCDTDMLVFKVWSEVKYGRCHSAILTNLYNKRYCFHLLCAPDLPWEFDPLRENADNRDQLFDLYEQSLKQENLPFVIVSGQGEHRVSAAIKAVETFLYDNSISKI